MPRARRDEIIASWIAENHMSRLPYAGKGVELAIWEAEERVRDFGRWLRERRRLMALS